MRLSWATRLAYACLVATLGAGIGYGAGTYVAEISGPRPDAGVAKIPETFAAPSEHRVLSTDEKQAATDFELRYKFVQAELDAAAANSERIDRLLTFLVTITLLYALALGINGYFALTKILENAKDETARALDDAKRDTAKVVAEAKKDAAEAQAEIKELGEKLVKTYPQYADLDENIKDIVENLRSTLDRSREWTELAWQRRSVEEREEIFMAEARLASLEVFRLGGHENDRQIIDIYRKLGRIYSAKHRAEGKRSDWYRASIYFRRAREFGVESPALLADVGKHLLQIEVMFSEEAADATPTPEMLELRSIANRALEQCLDRDAANVDALFTLGWLRSRESRFADALELSERLVRASKATDDQTYLVVVFYNLACFRLAIAPHDPDVERLALRDLKLSHDKALERGELRAWRERAQGDADLESLRIRYPGEMSGLMGTT